MYVLRLVFYFFFFQAEDGIRDHCVTGVQTCALPIWQRAGDLALIARRVAETTETPFMNVQDGFLTTHTIENLRLPELEFMKEYVGDSNDKIRCLFDPRNPIMTGVVQNQDSYMKGKIAQRLY